MRASKAACIRVLGTISALSVLASCITTRKAPVAEFEPRQSDNTIGNGHYFAVTEHQAGQVSEPAEPQPTFQVQPRTPQGAWTMLKEGNQRFVSGQSLHPNTDAARLHQAGSENQGDHAVATVITCSDSRVPVERIFDLGVMDTFIIRVAGNVCDTDEIGSIEYGLAHVNTPVLVVLGHTQCGAVTAVTHAVQGRGHALERNIPPLVDNIQPAVERTIQQHSNLSGDAVIPPAIEENVWQGIEDLYMGSPSTRNLVKSGKVKVLGAIYDVGTGKVRWLPESKSGQILAQVEADPARAMNAMAGGGHGDERAAAAPGAGGHGEASQADKSAVAAMVSKIENASRNTAKHEKQLASAGLGNTLYYLIGGLALLIGVGLTYYSARSKDQSGRPRLSWTLGAKLVGGFSAVAVVTAGVSVYAVTSLRNIGNEIAEIAEEHIPLTDAVSTIEAHQLEQSVFLERVFRFGEEEGAHAEEQFAEAVERFEQFAAQVDKEFEQAVALLDAVDAVSAEDAVEMSDALNGLATMAAEHKTFDALAEQAIELIKEKHFAKAGLLEEHIEQAEDGLNQEIEAFLLGLEKRTELAAQTAEQDEQRAALLLSIAAIVAVLAAFGIGLVLTRSITKPINRAIAGLTDGAEQVTDAAGQVSTASQQLAEGASEQASSLEETSSSLEQMAAMTRTNAENAKQANDLSEQARTAAQSGDQTTAKLNQSMTAINDSSGKISKIIKVIEEIAFQTNLLALNAAVEAARAGEHGKGFAVVAEEVRNLAKRAAEASSEITTLIEDSVNKAREGTQVAGEVGKSLAGIVGDVTKVADLLTGISQASQEQAQGVEQVNTAVAQMDKVTQQNAAGAEESASAAEQLSAQAETVKGMVDELRAVISGSGDGGSVTPGATRTRMTPIKKSSASAHAKAGHVPHDFSSAAKSATGKPVDKKMTEKEYSDALGEF